MGVYARRVADLWRTIGRDDPGNAEAQRNVYVYIQLAGDAHMMAGDNRAARAAFEEMRSLCEPLAAADPGSPQKRSDLTVCYERLIQMEEEDGQYSAAADWATKIMELSRRGEVDLAAANALATTRANGVKYEIALSAYDLAARKGLDDIAAINSRPPAVRNALLRIRCLALAKASRHREAAATAGRLLSLTTDPDLLAAVIRCYARCAVVADDPKLRAAYTFRAVTLLAPALPDQPDVIRAFVMAHPDFAIVRAHPKIAALLAEDAQQARKPGS
jgi:hypothetical protein